MKFFSIALLSAVFGFAEMGDESLFLEHQGPFVAYQSVTKRAYTLPFVRDRNVLVETDLGTGNTRILREFFEPMSFPLLGFSIDSAENRLFFVANIKEESYLYGIKLDTGKVLFRQELLFRPTLFTYDANSQHLFGLASKRSMYYWVRIDPQRGELKVLKSFPEITGIAITPVMRRGRMSVFHGYVKKKEGLYGVDLNSGKLKLLQAIQVNVDHYRIQFFRRDKHILYTLSTQLCVSICGLDRTAKMGFLGHFSPAIHDFAHILEQIDDELQRFGSGGIGVCEVVVVGGIKSDVQSFRNVQELYRALTRYQPTYQPQRAHHLGKQYNIIIGGKQVEVF